MFWVSSLTSWSPVSLTTWKRQRAVAARCFRVRIAFRADAAREAFDLVAALSPPLRPPGRMGSRVDSTGGTTRHFSFRTGMNRFCTGWHAKCHSFSWLFVRQRITSRFCEETSMLGTILLIVLVLMLLGALPTWPHSRSWGYYPSGGLGLIVVILLLLILLGRL
jgi:hypothetical protein